MIRTLLALALLLAISFGRVAGQQVLPAEALAGQSLRAYWHVFIAYAIVLVLVGGYVVSIARRLSDVEKRLGE